MRIRIRTVTAFFIVVGLVQANTAQGAEAALGQILDAEHARLGTIAVTGGTTLYAGERLETDALGRLHAQVGSAQIYLAKDSSATMMRGETGAGVTLERGAAVALTPNARAFELVALGAHFRAQGTESALWAVSVVSANEVEVMCQRGALTVFYGGESKTILAGSTYRGQLRAAGPEGASDSDPADQTQAGGKRKIILIWTAIAVAATLAVLIPLLLRASQKNQKQAISDP